MGKGGGGGGQPQVSTAYQTNLPEYAEPYVKNMLQAAEAQVYAPGKTGFREYTPYSSDPTDYFAGPSSLQQSTYGEAANMQTPSQFAPATGMAGLAGLGQLGAGNAYQQMATSPGAISSFMSPFAQNVIDVQKAAAMREAQIGNVGNKLAAARQGTYGGAREALGRLERERSLQSRLGEIQATGSQQAYDRAIQNMQFGSNLGLQGLAGAASTAGTLGQLGGQQQQADLSRMGFQNQLGQQQQQFQQNIINQAIQDYATQQQYPFMQLSTMSNLLRGLPMQGMTTQQYQAQPSALQQGIGLLGSGASLYGAMGRKEGGAIKEYRGGGGIKASLENKIDDIADAGGVKGLQALLAQTKSPQAKEMITERMREEGIARANTGGLMTNMAGGGIIAFEKGGDVKHFFNEGAVEDEEMSELDKIRANNEAIKSAAGKFFDLSNYDPLQQGYRAYKQFVYDPITKAVNKSPEEQAVGFRKASDARDGKRGMFTTSKEEQKKDDRDIAAAKASADVRKKTEAAKAKQANTSYKFDPDAIDREDAGIGAALRANQVKPKPDTPPPAAPATTTNVNQSETGIDAILEARRKRLGVDGPGEKNEALMKALEERQAGMGKQNETDRYLRMAEAFAKFGSTAGPIGRTASEALGGFAKGEAGARKEQDKMQVEGMKIQADLEKARRAEARGDLDAAEKLYTSAADRENRLQVSREAANRPGEFEKMMAAFRANPEEFEKFRKSLTASDDTARLNAMVKADATLAGNFKYMNLLNSKKPEDQQTAATMRTNLINEYMSALGATQPSAPGKVIDFGSIK